MGAAACTLLWGVSSSEEVVKAILGAVSMANWTLLINANGLGGYSMAYIHFFHQIILEFQWCGVLCNLVLWGYVKLMW